MADSYSRTAGQRLASLLLQTADPALLDETLDALARAVDDDDLRSMLVALDESGDAHSLRIACRNGSLERFLEERCTARESATIERRLRELSTDGSNAADDPTRLVRLEPMPDDPDELLAWARRHRVGAELARPISEILGQTDLGASVTLLEACFAASKVSHSSAPLADDALETEARAYLRAEAARSLAGASRLALWAGRLRPEVSRLGERLRAFIGSTTLDELGAVRFVPTKAVRLDRVTGAFEGRVRAADGRAIGVELYLAGYEHRGLTGRCEVCSSERCLHLRALAARALDACFDATDRLAGEFGAFAAMPSWKGFVDALVGPTRNESSAVEFVVRFRTSGIAIAPATRSAKARGATKLVPAAKLLKSAAPTDRDRAILETMVASSRTFGTAFVLADAPLLRSLVGHPSVRDEASGERLQFVEQNLHVEMAEVAGGVTPKVSLGGIPLTPGDRGRAHLIVERDVGAGTLYFAALPPAVRRLLSALEHYRSVLPEESYSAIAPFVASLREVARVTLPPAFDGLERPPPEKLVLRLTPRFDAGVDASIVVRVFAMAPPYPPGFGPELVHGLERGIRVVSRRDRPRERMVAARVVEALGVDEHPEVDTFVYRVDSTPAALELLARAARTTDLLDIEWAEGRRKFTVVGQLRTADVALQITRKGQYLSLEGRANVGKDQVPLHLLFDAARRGERFVRIAGDDYAEIERDLFDRLENASLSVAEHDHELAVAIAAAPSLLRALEGLSRVTDGETDALLAEAIGTRRGELTLPELGATLRDYQEDGVRFLLGLARWAPGACLADEMGLGKTVQSIGLLCARKELGPALVVAPTSMVSSWAASIERFGIGLRPLVFRGEGRAKMLASLGPGDVLITSFDLVLRDVERLREHTYATLVVDEAQLVKNSRTTRARALVSIDATFRVALTGTPIENRLGDLFGIFQQVAPALLGTAARFRARFAVPIERYDDADRAAALRALVSPFLLRRTKDDVESELPSRTEVVHHVELSPAERELYDGAERYARAMLDRHFREKAGRSLEILAELTRLRQLACHPRLAIADTELESSKLAAFLELTTDLARRGHRMLVFSQFTTHLALVREALVARRVPHLYLDGGTPGEARADLVARFQAGEGTAFLISLKAGGTGLDLTAADYVIHLDPWWNPAAEDQASDRAHRIGQDKPVTIVRLVARGTIEEKVLELHARKRALADAILDGDLGRGPIDLDELRSLLGADSLD